MPTVPVYPPIKTIRIELYYEDSCTRGSNTFQTVQQLADFLKDNPEIAKAVGYVAKPRK